MPRQSLSNRYLGRIDLPLWSPLHPFTFLLHPLCGGVRSREGLYALQEPELWCVINTDKVTDLKPSTIQAAGMKISSIPAMHWGLEGTGLRQVRVFCHHQELGEESRGYTMLPKRAGGSHH